MAEVVRFVEDRIKGEEGKESRALRGPFLARLELMHRLRERGCPEESLLGKGLENWEFSRILTLFWMLYLLVLCVFKQVSL